MTTIFDVAKYILNKCGEMSIWKLQRLCYYAQAWTLAWDSKPLFDEDFQAWRNAPVCPELYALTKGKFVINEDEFHVGDKANLDEEQAENVDIVIRDYGDKDSWWLREQVSSEAPFASADFMQTIDKDAMGEYYGSL